MIIKEEKNDDEKILLYFISKELRKKALIQLH
jgi:hypothetical protein